jgi:hypothetical protein
MGVDILLDALQKIGEGWMNPATCYELAKKAIKQHVEGGGRPEAKTSPRKVCPCEFGDPCNPRCTCANGGSSLGCRRCCKYGSQEQRAAKAKMMIEQEKAKVFAPKDCVIDDKGDIIEGKWTSVNGGHGDFHWRFDADASTDDD